MKTFLKKTIALACFAMLMPLSLLESARNRY